MTVFWSKQDDISFLTIQHKHVRSHPLTNILYAKLYSFTYMSQRFLWFECQVYLAVISILMVSEPMFCDYITKWFYIHGENFWFQNRTLGYATIKTVANGLGSIDNYILPPLIQLRIKPPEHMAFYSKRIVQTFKQELMTQKLN